MGFVLTAVRFVIRIAAIVVFACAMAALGMDAAKSLETGFLATRSTGAWWSALLPGSFERSRHLVRSLSPEVWTYGAEPLLSVPFFAVGLALWLFLLWASAKRRPDLAT